MTDDLAEVTAQGVVSLADATSQLTNVVDTIRVAVEVHSKTLAQDGQRIERLEQQIEAMRQNLLAMAVRLNSLEGRA
jgi:hypothetical protein